MSRNLCSTTCDYCYAHVKLEESPRPITKEEAKGYFEEYEGMLVANAICEYCEAKYLAWVDETPRLIFRDRDRRYKFWGTHMVYTPQEPMPSIGYFDLSFRKSFNDEPAEEDLPKYQVDTVIVRTRKGPIQG